MELVFTKGSGKYDRMEVLRTDGATERIDCPKQRMWNAGTSGKIATD